MEGTELFKLINELIGHLIWPLCIFGVLFLFKKKIELLFQVLKKIKLKDFEAEFEQREKSFAEEEVSPINDELEVLNQKIKDLESIITQQNGLESKKIQDIDNVNEATRKRIIDALNNEKYRWRSLETLSSISGVSKEAVRDAIITDQNIVLSKGKSGRQIVRLKNR